MREPMPSTKREAVTIQAWLKTKAPNGLWIDFTEAQRLPPYRPTYAHERIRTWLVDA